MKIYRIIVVSFLVLLTLTVTAQNDLDVYLQTAAKNNPGLNAKFKDYMAALEVVPQVTALPDPQLAFAWFISPIETRLGPQRAKISASQMFPWFGTLQTKGDVASEIAKSKYEIFLEVKSSLFNEVRSTYYNIYFNKRAIEITKENLTILNTFQKLAIIKVEAGKVSAVDEYRIEMEIGDLENQLALLRDQQLVLEVMFNNQLNVENDQSIQTPEILWTNDLDFDKSQVLNSLKANNHQLLVLSLQKQALIFREELASKQGMPDFSIGLDYAFIGAGSNNLPGTDAFVFPKIGITIPLYRQKYKAMVNEVVYLQESKNLEISDKVNILETVFENSWKDYKDADRRIHLYTSQTTLAEQSLMLLETEYATGNKDFEEILRMERKLLQYGLNLEKARADKQASISFIKYLMGV